MASYENAPQGTEEIIDDFRAILSSGVTSAVEAVDPAAVLLLGTKEADAATAADAGESPKKSEETHTEELPEVLQFGVKSRQRRLDIFKEAPLRRSLKTVSARLKVTLNLSEAAQLEHDSLLSYVAGGAAAAGGADSSDEEPGVLRRSRPKTKKDPLQGLYWPPHSWSLYKKEDDEDEKETSKRGRRGTRFRVKKTAKPAASHTKPNQKSRRRRTKPEHDSNVKVGFTDKGRDVAVTDTDDIKLSLKQQDFLIRAEEEIRATWRTYASQAEASMRQKKYQTAKKLFDKCLFLEPPPEGIPRCLIGRSVCARHLGDYSQALADARSLLKTDPHNAHAILAEADALLATGEPEMALIRYHRGRKIRPGLQAFNDGVRRCEKTITDIMDKSVPLRVPEGYGTEQEEHW